MIGCIWAIGRGSVGVDECVVARGEHRHTRRDRRRRVRHALDELVRDKHGELEALDEVHQLILTEHVDVQDIAEELVEAVCAATRRHDPHAVVRLEAFLRV